MTDSEFQKLEDESNEGPWAYISGPIDVGDPQREANLYDRLADTCAAAGWHVYCSYRDEERNEEEAPLVARLRHALGHADLCVLYVGRPSSRVGAELAWAYEHGRPVIAVHLREEEPSHLLASLLSDYSRARTVTCTDLDDCMKRVRDVLRDTEWERIIRASAAELAEDIA